MINNWYFPHGENLIKTGHNNSSIEMFLDNIGRSLTREIIQNSLDAHDATSNEPVKVVFNQFEIAREMVPGINQIANKALPKAKKMWREYPETYQFLKEFDQVINSENITVLQISDYNTTGLNNENYETLITGNNFSTKNSIDSAGSKGIGKAAPFAASELRMVFYNSNSIEDGIKSAGVLNFVSFQVEEVGENVITQERAIYRDENLDYIDKQITFGTPERKKNKYGTDLFIMGLKDLEDWKQIITLATINNFLLSIYRGDLEVIVYDRKINSKTLEKIMSEMNIEDLSGNSKTEFKATMNYFKVLTNENTQFFNLPEKFLKKYDFIANVEDGYLLLLDVEPANRKILQTRKAGMKIYERGHIDSMINFTGVFQATSQRFNAFLKDLENANHNNWSIDRKKGKERQIAQDLLKDLLHWFKDKVKESYGVINEKESDAIGVSDLLPIEETGDGKQKDSGIKNNFLNLDIKRKSNTPRILDGDKENDSIDKYLDEIRYDEDVGNESGPGSKREGKGGGNSPHNEHGIGEENGTNNPNIDGENKIIGDKKQKLGKNAMKLKLIGINPQQGKYRLVGKSNARKSKLLIELKSVGDNGSSYNIDLTDVSSPSLKVRPYRNNILISSVKKNQNIIIDFKIFSKLRMKMEVVQYEITG